MAPMAISPADHPPTNGASPSAQSAPVNGESALNGVSHLASGSAVAAAGTASQMTGSTSNNVHHEPAMNGVSHHASAATPTSTVEPIDVNAQHVPQAAPKPEPIAIVGYACRASGDVSNPDQLWELCTRGRSGWSPIPKTRFNAEAYYHPHPSKVGCANPQGGYFLSQDVALFDAPFFGITAEEAKALDPQMRILLECTFEAIESAGIPKENLIGSDTGVFVGGSFADYELNNLRDLDGAPRYAATGAQQAMLSNRISYCFDLRGPSFTADTACSSSLVALHQAMQSLRSGESDHAIVGSCHLNLLPDYFTIMSTSQLMGDTGKTFAFDHRAKGGFGRGEGSGCLILKPLSRALKDNDAVRGVIVNTGINQDGKTNGITVPNGAAQEKLVRKVYADAGISPADCGFAEMHGTGTKVGDPIEATAVHNVLGVGRTARKPLYIGSVKTQIGHLEGASGVMSIIKASMMLEKNLILPNANFERANDAIPLAEWNMKVPTSVRPWPVGKRYCSVSNYGFGGANAHAVLERPPAPEEVALSKPLEEPHWRLFVLSANDPDSLKARMNDLTFYLQQRPEVFEKSLAGRIAYTLGQRRSHLNYRIAFPATSSDELGLRLASSKVQLTRSNAEPKLGFVFTGQGAQWARMGMDLLTDYPVFAQAINDAEACLKKLGADFSLIEELRKPGKESQVNLAHISQPACTAVQIGLTMLLKSWGIIPVSVTGHSSGSIGAAFAADIIDLESAMALAHYRGKATVSLKKRFPELKGTMLAVGAGADTIRPLLKTLKSGYATIACINSPASITISGDESAIDELQPLIAEREIFNRKLKVDQAYHSEHMGRVADEYLESIKDIKPRSSSSAIYFSSLHGRVAEPSELQPAYWVGNLTSPVQFAESTKEMCSASEGPTLLVEVGPHPALAGPVKDILKGMGEQGRRIAYIGAPIARDKNPAETALELSGALFARGSKLDFSAINFPKAEKAQPPSLITDLPSYQWNHSKRYWHDNRIAKNHLQPTFARNDIVGRLASYSNDLEPVWRNYVRLDEMPWLRHHKMQGMVVYPLTGYISQAVEAASQRAQLRKIPFDRFEFREVVVSRALVLEEGAEVETNIILRPYAEGTRSYSTTWDEFTISSYESKRGWIEHCKGHVGVRLSDKANSVDGPRRIHSQHKLFGEKIAAIEADSTGPVNVEEMYESLLKVGVEYGPMFQGFSSSMASDRCGFADINSTPVKSLMPNNYEPEVILHPSLCDIFIQIMWPILGAGRMGLDTYHMPTSIERLSLARDIPGDFKAYATKEANQTKFDIFAIAPEDPTDVLIHFDGITMTPLRNMDDSSAKMRELCYKLQWEPAHPNEAEAPQLNGVANGAEVNGVKEPEQAMNGIAAVEAAAVLEGDTRPVTNGANSVDANTTKIESIVKKVEINGVSPAAAMPEQIATLQPEKTLGMDVAIVYLSEKQKQLASRLADDLVPITSKRPVLNSLSDVDAEGKLLLLLDIGDPLLENIDEKGFYQLQCALTKAGGAVWVIAGAFQNSTSPSAHMAVGFTRSIRSETLAKIGTVDLDIASLADMGKTSSTVLDVVKTIFCAEPSTVEVDMEYMERNGELLVPRVVDDTELDTFIQRETQDAEPHEQLFSKDGRRLKLTIGMHGALDTLHFVDDNSGPLKPDYVEIEIKATGMNFKDVVIAMGQVQSPYIGVESSGIVTSVGKAVKDVQIGQRVMAMTEGAYSTYARCKSTSVHPIPDHMSFESAATIPVIFCTAYYALITLAHLEADESVLIHAAAGGVGQAAIMLAQMIGAEIFATCGSADKKNFLMETYGIPEDHIFFSRDTSFAAPLLQATGGKGVDVVLNSLASDILRQSWECLAHFGRFIEIGKRDIVSNTRLEMAKFEHNATFSSVDLTLVAAERPALMKKLITSVCSLLERKIIKPIQPMTVYKISEVESAIRVLQSGKNMGKLVVVPQPGDMVKATPLRSGSNLLRGDSSYIIIGGTGGLGRSMARWMSSKGAKHIVLVSRSGQASDKVQQLQKDLVASGTNIHVFPCDVAEADSVSHLIIEKMASLPPVRGIIHAAMVLRDVLYEQMTYKQYTEVISSKVAGTWNLHNALSQIPLDFFIALSSVAGIVGNRGQAAYAAANTFLDAFMQYRNAQGLPGTALDLTAVSDVGYLAENAAHAAEVSKNLGDETLQETEVLALLAAAINGTITASCGNHCITGLKVAPAALGSLFFVHDAKFTHLRRAAAAELEGQADAADPTSIPLPTRLRAAATVSYGAVVQTLYEALVAKLSAVLMIPAESMDKDQSITSFGLDSLAAIEIRNWIARELEASLQVLEILTSASLWALCKTMATKSKLVEVKEKKEDAE